MTVMIIWVKTSLIVISQLLALLQTLKIIIVVRVCALKYGNVLEYTIPSFSVIKVKLRQAVIQTVDTSGEPVVLDVFFREDSSLNTKLPQELIVDEACIVDVSGLHVLSVNRMSSCAFLL